MSMKLGDKLDWIKEIEKKATEALLKRSLEERKEGIGVLRGGSAGAVVVDEKGERKSYCAAYSCARKAQARLIGVELPPEEDKLDIYSAGIAHEVRLAEIFDAAGIDYEREKPVKSEGWSGRPDFMIDNVGIEAKAYVHPGSVSFVHKGNKWPKMAHCVQACAYMVYANKDSWLIGGGHYFFVFFQDGYKDVPALDEEGNQIVKKAKNWKDIGPGRVWFELLKKDGNFYIMNQERQEVKLPFTETDIRRYYKELSEFNEKKVLGDRPHEEEIEGKISMRCLQCPMKKSCKAYDNNKLSYDEWLEIMKLGGDKHGKTK